MSNLAKSYDYSETYDFVVPQEPRRAEVLIIDDSQFDRKRMRRALSRLPVGMNITETANLAGIDAVLANKRFDIILVDYALQDGDGLEALELIRSSALNQDANAVMVTGNDSSSLAVVALKLGFDDYVTKDALDADVLSALLSAAQTKADQLEEAKVVPFPTRAVSEATISKDILLSDLALGRLGNSLTPVLQSALETAMARVQMEEIASNVVSLVASFDEEDDFVFKDLH